MKISKICPKCGYDDTVMTFYKKGKTVYQQDKDFKVIKEYLKEVSAETPYTNAKYEIKTECLKLHCRTCQYAWVSKTADSKVQDNAFGLDEEAIKKLAEELNESAKKIQEDISKHISRPGFVDVHCTDFSGRPFQGTFGSIDDFFKMFPNGSYNGWDK